MRTSHKEQNDEPSRVDNHRVVTKFGTRAVSNQNFSKIVALPKEALNNCGGDIKRVHVALVQEGRDKFLKLTPVQEDE